MMAQIIRSKFEGIFSGLFVHHNIIDFPEIITKTQKIIAIVHTYNATLLIASIIHLYFFECHASPIATESPIKIDDEKIEVKPNNFCDTEYGTDAAELIVLPINIIVLLCKTA